MKHGGIPSGALGQLARLFPGVAVSRPGAIKAVAYAVFFAVSFLVSFAWRFPSGAIVTLAGKAVEGVGMSVTAGSARLWLPLGIKMSDVTLFHPAPGKNVEIVSAKNVEANVTLFTALTLRKGVHAWARTLGGSIEFNMAQRLFNRAVTEAEISLKGINPGLVPALAQSGLARLNGSLDGDGSFSFEGSDPLKGAGSLKARLTRPGSITLSKALGDGLGDVAVDIADAEISFKSGALNLDRLVIKGPLISVSVTGDALVNANPMFTRLNMKAEIRLYGNLAERLQPLLSFFQKGPDGVTVIRVTGTPGAPVFR
jgi:type II secretion system protein N